MMWLRSSLLLASLSALPSHAFFEAPTKPTFLQDENHPAISLNLNEAKAFCDWLTVQDRKAGLIGIHDRYRVPTDHEWSCAAGFGDK